MIHFLFPFRTLATCSALLVALAALAPSRAVSADNGLPLVWATSVSAVEHSVADGLPVLALGGGDWPQRLTAGSGEARAAQRIEAKWLAYHPSGWRLGAVARSQASVNASPSSLALAQALDSKAYPAGDTTFGLSAQHVGWRGRGVEVGIPWQAIGDGGWQWTADAQWLQLTDLRTTRIEGLANYVAAGNGYDFDVSADRSNPRITGPFLGAAGSAGTGVSLSLGIKGHIRPDWFLTVRAYDVASRLQWDRMAQDRLRLNTQVTRLRPDGLLDYDPAVIGLQSVGAVATRMGPRWDSQLTWQFSPAAAVSTRWVRAADMDELWLGWDATWPGSTIDVYLGYEGLRQAVATRLAWRGLYLSLATDGRGAKAEYRQIALGWHLRF